MSTDSKMYRDELRNHFQGQMQKTKLQASTKDSVHKHIIRSQREDDDEDTGDKLRKGPKSRQRHRMQKPNQKAEYSSSQQQQHPTQESSNLDQDQKYNRHYRQEPSKHHQQQSQREYQHGHQHGRHGLRQQQPEQTTNEQSTYRMNTPCQHRACRSTAIVDDIHLQTKETNENRHLLSNVTKEVDKHQGATSSFGYPHSLLSIDVTPYRNKTKKTQHRQSSASQHDHYSSYDMCSESQLCSLSALSDCSDRSLRTSKTVVSRKSAQDLREMVRSQIALQTVVDESLSALNREKASKEKEVAAFEKPIKTITAVAPSQLSRPFSTDLNQCPVCHVKIKKTEESIQVITAKQSEKRSMSNPADDCGAENNDSSSNTPFSVSIDDVVNSKVINPMIRKLQRMYLNSLKEEMSLMEDLERLPHMVSEVYKANKLP